MRISDWSSDVCSSDLMWIMVLLILVMFASFFDRALAGILAENIKRDLNLTDGELGWALGVSFTQIGRASCRERVLSVRVDLGGRRIIKKKNNSTLQNL